MISFKLKQTRKSNKETFATIATTRKKENSGSQTVAVG
jgi:hypothetical protein